MTTKQYLNQIRKSDWMIKTKAAEIMQLDILATSITASVGNERVQSSGSQDRMGDTIAKIADAKDELMRLALHHVDIRSKIVEQINSMADNYRYYCLLELRYVQYKTFEDIADEMHYSWRQVMNLHNDALNEFEARFGSDYKNIA